MTLPRARLTGMAAHTAIALTKLGLVGLGEGAAVTLDCPRGRLAPCMMDPLHKPERGEA